MAKVSFTSKWGRVSTKVTKGGAATGKPPEEVIRDLKKSMQKPSGEDYRERSLAIHGLVCARCGREFESQNLQLLTVHHKDGNHLNNPPDGSNWENLCAYCHEDVHSRGVLGDYLQGAAQAREATLVFRQDADADGTASGLGVLGDKLKQAMARRQKK